MGRMARRVSGGGAGDERVGCEQRGVAYEGDVGQRQTLELLSV